jgi:peptidylprolyl isomerase
MRTTLALLAALGIASASLAQQPPQGQPGQPSTDQFTIETAQPQGIPVPDMPVIERRELEGGLIVEEMKIGEGYEVKPGGWVVAHYHGTLQSDGSVFDSSFQRGEPVAFPLTGVIMGWQQGVPGMKIGGIRKLTIPAAMAYGEQARPGIPANSDLVFVVQLVDAVQVEEIEEGEGEDAFGQFVAVTAHKIRDAEGNVVEEATAEDPYIWIPGEFQGLNAGMEGMKRGGKRKIHVPSQMNQVHPGQETKRPGGVPLEIEIQMIALRNLQPRR